MCDYSLHAVASRPAVVGETLITTTFPGTSTRGFASEREPAMAVCMLPGTELAFARDVKYDNRWIWTRTLDWRVGQFNQIAPDVPDRHHDAIELRGPARYRAANAGGPGGAHARRDRHGVDGNDRERLN